MSGSPDPSTTTNSPNPSSSTSATVASKCRKGFDFRYVVNNLDSEPSSELMMSHHFPPKVTVSGTDIRAKEVVLVSMALLLLVCSLCLFFKHWKKNYRDINQVSEWFMTSHKCSINAPHPSYRYQKYRFHENIVRYFDKMVLDYHALHARNEILALF